MSISVAAAFACAVIAAIGTGVLIGRCIRLPRLDTAAWACALAGLAVSAGAQALGAADGYGSPTFRAAQIGAQLVAPLGLAWGLAQLAGRSEVSRFAATLVVSALTVVVGVVLVTDPLSGTGFGKTWPAASAHYQIIAKSLLTVAAVVTVAVAVLALLFTVARAWSDRGWRDVLVAVVAAAAAAAALVCLRLRLPVHTAYPAVCAASALLTWFAGVWAGKVPIAELHGDNLPEEAGRRRRRSDAADDDIAGDAWPEAQRRYGEYGGGWYGEEGWQQPGGADALAEGDQRNGGNPANGGYRRDGGYDMSGLRRGGGGQEPDPPWAAARGQQEDFPAESAPGEAAGQLAQEPLRPGAEMAGAWGAAAAGDEAMGSPAATAQAAGRGAGGPADQGAARRLYGLIAIYTLAEGCAAEFDALAERVVDDVRSNEPDALVYAVHSVPNAAMQRIFYEVYRDRMAYEEHKRQPHIHRFEAERAPYVAATNVIELGTQQAKLSTLPGLTQTFGRPAGG